MGAGNGDLVGLTFADPVFADPKYSDGGGAVNADVIFDKALASGFNGNTNVADAINPNVAIASVAAQIAGFSWDLVHSSSGEAQAFNPFFDADIDVLSSSDIMRQGPGPNVARSNFPTSIDMPFFQNYSMMCGDFNQDPTSTDPSQTFAGNFNAYDQFINDPDIGPNAGGIPGNPFPLGIGGYITGTGAFDVIKITPDANPDLIDVTVSPFRDNSYQASSFISTWSERLGNFTSFDTSTPGQNGSLAGPETYSIDITSGLPILIELGRGSDLLQIDPTIQGVIFVVYGGENGVDNLQMIDNPIGGQSVTVTPSNLNSQAFNFNSRFDTTLTVKTGASTSMTVQAFEFEDDSTLHLEGFNTLDFEPPKFLGANVSVTTSGGNMVIDGSAGPTLTSALVKFANVEFTNIANVLISVAIGVTNDTVTLHTNDAFETGLSTFTVNLGPGTNDQLILDDWDPRPR